MASWTDQIPGSVAGRSHCSSEDEVHIQRATTFITEEASRVHSVFGGTNPANLQNGQEDRLIRFKKLAIAVEEYTRDSLDATLAIDTEDSTTVWSELYERIATAEDMAYGRENGPSAIFQKLILEVGDHKDVIDPWLALIPNEYGLSIVKSAIAIILNSAQGRAQERQQVFDTLAGIRDIIGKATLKTRSLREDPQISKCVERLHDAIVKAIEEILQQFSKCKPRRISKHKISSLMKLRRTQKSGLAQDDDVSSHKTSNLSDPKTEQQKSDQKRDKFNPSAILLNVKTRGEELDLAVDEYCRKVINMTSYYSQNTNLQTGVILRWIFTEADAGLKDAAANFEQVKTMQDKTYRFIETLRADFDIIMTRRIADGALFELLEERSREITEWIRRRRPQLVEARRMLHHTPGDTAPHHNSTAIITLYRLLMILCQIDLDQDVDDVESVILQLDEDLTTVIKRATRTEIPGQGQIQSVFHERRIVDWINTGVPDLILLDGNIRTANRKMMSAMTLFCTNFVIRMRKAGAEDICTYFICGLHDRPKISGDRWTGVSGLLRCLIMQLLLVLDERKMLSLDFLSSRGHVRELEEDDIHRLCSVLHKLIKQFPADTTVYCVVDGISTFARKDPESIATVVHCLQTIVEDDGLRPIFKVMLTESFRSPPTLSRLIDDENRHICLSSRHSDGRRLNQRVMNAKMSRLSTPSRDTRSRSPRLRGQADQDPYPDESSEDDEDTDSDEEEYPR